jgi:hypothetical protein
MCSGHRLPHACQVWRHPAPHDEEEDEVMVRVRRGRTALGAAALVASLGAGATACGDDEVAAPSTADFCLELEQSDDGDDSGPYSTFYDKHPDPTPADWAADGHLVTESIQASIEEVEAVNPSEEARPLVDEALAALEAMKQNSIEISEAGKNDDQAAIDELERVNQDANVPAVMAAFESVVQLCTASPGS